MTGSGELYKSIIIRKRNPMRILMLTTNSSLMDGINRHILTISTALDKYDDLDVAVCTVQPEGELHAALGNNGVTAFALGYRNGHETGVASKYCDIIKSFRPDIIHCHVMAFMERVTSSVLFRDMRYMRTIHGIPDRYDNPTARMRIESLVNMLFPIRWSADLYISNGVKDVVGKQSRKAKISTVCYNPIPFRDVPPRKKTMHKIIGVPPDTQIIGTSCRISYPKNPQAFTEVFCSVLKRIPSCHAVVLGDGDKEIITECGQIVDGSGVGDRFHWLGYRIDAPSLSRDLDCYVQTSRWEGLPTTILENMAMKTPIAMFDGRGGLHDLYTINRNESEPIIQIVQQGDIDRLVEKVIFLLNNPQYAVKMAENAYNVGKRYFDIDIVSRQLHDIYKSVLS